MKCDTRDVLARNDGNIGATLGPGSGLQNAGVPHWFFYGTSGLLPLAALVNMIAFGVLLDKMWATVKSRALPHHARQGRRVPVYSAVQYLLDLCRNRRIAQGS